MLAEKRVKALLDVAALVGQVCKALLPFANGGFQPGDGAAGATVRGLGKGWVFGGLDELGAVADSLGGTAGRENVWNSDRRWGDIWYNNQQQNSAILGFDEENYPYHSYGGEVVGAIGSGVMLPYSASLRVPQLARYGAGYGAAYGFLGTDGSVPDRLTGAAIGGTIGAIADPALVKLVQAGAPAVARGARSVAEGARGIGRRISDALPGSRGFVDIPGGAMAGDDIAGAVDDVADLPPLPEGAVLNPRSQEMAMAGETGESISEALTPPVRPGRMSDPLADAQRRELAEQVEPGDFLPLPANQVDGVDEAAAISAGRYPDVRVPNERDELTRSTVRNYMGQPVPKVGPIDLVGWLRLQGGLREYRGELRALGITNNAARRGLDHVGQESRFGPMLNDDGMTLDDAALYSWEAGYFPELTERPTISQFLDAVGATYNGGSGRRFNVDDFDELYAYSMRQGERWDLEQLQHYSGRPVSDDIATGGGEDAPFPPVEAYDEWPSDAIARVGNIDVRRLESPQDIRRALKTTHNMMGGFDAARRGRITNAETENLASELGMTADDLLRRRRGQAFNAEEALAARQILAKSGNELVNAARRLRRLGDDPGADEMARFRQAWVRHVAIQEQVAGITAEAGRVLQQFKQAASSREVRADVLEALVRGGGGRETMMDAADALIDAARISPGAFNNMASRAMQPRWRDKISELYINALLSNPPTHIVNMVSNSLTALAHINLLKFATERSIAAPLLKEWRADFRAGGDRRDMAIARVMLGTGFMAVMYEAALDGRITGAVPPDPAKARLMYADGWQPYSVRIGDRWVSYSRLDPFSTTIGVAADMATLPDGLSDRQQEDQATMLVASIMGNLANKTWMSGMSSFIEGLSDPGRYAGNWLERLTSSFAVPAGVAGVARSMDPVARRRDNVGEAIQARIPGMSDDLLPNRNVFGEVRTTDSLGPDFLSPFWQSQARNDPVVAEMMRIGKSVSPPGRQQTVDGERVDYSPEEYDRYHEIAGRLTYNALLAQIASPEWERMTTAQQQDAASRSIREARSIAREQIDNMGYQLPNRGAAFEEPADDTPALPPGAAMQGLPPLPPGARMN